jgi:hypothetical protein
MNKLEIPRLDQFPLTVMVGDLSGSSARIDRSVNQQVAIISLVGLLLSERPEWHWRTAGSL